MLRTFLVDVLRASKQLRPCLDFIDYLLAQANFADQLLCPTASSFIRDYLPWLEGRAGRSHDAQLL